MIGDPPKQEPASIRHFDTIKIVHLAKLMVQDCERADSYLHDVLKFTDGADMMSKGQKDTLKLNAAKLRTSLQFSVKYFREVIKLWEHHTKK